MGIRWFVFFEHVLGKDISLHSLLRFFLSVILLSHSAYSQTPQEQTPELPVYETVFSENSQQKILVGDQLKLKVMGLPNELAQAVLNEHQETESLEELGWDVSDEKGIKKGSDFEFSLVPIKSGKLTLPSLIILNGEGKKIGLTKSLILDISSAIDPKSAEWAKLKPPLRLPFPLVFVILLGLGFLVLLAGLIFLLRYWFKQRKLPKTIAVTKVIAPMLSEDEAALNSLGELENQKLMQKGRFKVHYFKTSEIMKRYIGTRYGFYALESTSQEIIRKFDEYRILSDGSSESDDFRKYLISLDRVKFTDYTPGHEEGSEILKYARSFIEKTRRKKELEKEKENAL